jgi:hypothetical protein
MNHFLAFVVAKSIPLVVLAISSILLNVETHLARVVAAYLGAKMKFFLV